MSTRDKILEFLLGHALGLPAYAKVCFIFSDLNLSERACISHVV